MRITRLSNWCSHIWVLCNVKRDLVFYLKKRPAKGTDSAIWHCIKYSTKPRYSFRAKKSHPLSRPESNDLNLHWMFPPKMCRKPEVLFYSWRVSIFRQQRTLPDVLKWAARCYLYLDRFNRSTFYRFSAVNGCCFRAQVFSAVFFIDSHGQWNPYPVWFRG